MGEVSTPIDMTGQRFGRLLVLRRSPRKHAIKQAVWECQCDCGTVVDVPGGSLRTGRQTCGCSRGPYHGVFDQGGAGVVFGKYRKNAERQGRVFELTPEQFLTITQQPCHYCGAPPAQEGKSKAGLVDFIYNGIDRKDNGQGYTLGNVAPCCAVCNRMKLDLGVDVFLEHVRRIVAHQNSL